MSAVGADDAAGRVARAGIAANNAAFSAALRRRDPAGMAACYTPHALLLPPGYPTIGGREGIEAFWSSGILAGLRSVELETLALDVRNDRAVEVGRATVTLEPDEGEPVRDVGKYLVVHRHAGDRWLWEIDIFNSDGS